MTTPFNRPPRLQFPALPQEEIQIPPPPDLPNLPEQNWLVNVVPVMGISVMALFYLLRATSNSDGGSALFAVPLFLLALFTIGGTLLAQRWRRRDYERQRDENRINYIRLLERKRARLQAARDAHRAILEHNFPNPQHNLNLALSRNPQVWERRPDDTDFTAFRLGTGRIPLPIPITTPDPDMDSPELERAFALADEYRYIHAAPIVASLQRQGPFGFCGRRDLVLDTVQAIVCHLALTHQPQDFHIYLIADEYEDWRWLEWLPHTSISHRGGMGDFIAFEPDTIRNLLGSLGQVVDERLARQAGTVPHLLVIFDEPHLAEHETVFKTIMRDGYEAGVSAVCITETYNSVPGECQTVIEIDDDGRFNYAETGPQGYEITTATVDTLAYQDAEHIARALASISTRSDENAGRLPRQVDFLDLYGVRHVEDLRSQIQSRWRRTVADGVLPFPVPIGRESLTTDTTIWLDEDHHGPHGVLAGTTGSGKSELLQTLICALAVEHKPEWVNFLLIDFKGGSSFNVFADLPHTVGMVTNLDGALIERVLEALKAEITDRQQRLKQANVRDITQYHRYYADRQPLPHLFIIVDEFAQLAREMPNFLHELVRTAQVGRSLGLHLILGTQSPMDVITDEMNANLQFRICLRVQNIEASRAMLRRPDAAYLPAGWPGRGFLQVGERGLFKQFQTAHVGADYRPEATIAQDSVLELITDDGRRINLLPNMPEAPNQTEPYTIARAVVETIIDLCETTASPLLLPPLDDAIPIPLPDEQPIKVGSAPVGIVDDIYNRAQYPLWIHLNEQEQPNRRDGHVLVMGAPGTGKTTFIRTLALSLAVLHPPDKLHLYILSLAGGGLDDLSGLPHAERVIRGTEGERVRRLFRRLIETLENRQTSTVKLPIIVLCIDQYEQFRDGFYDQHNNDLLRLINEGRAAGIYVVLTANSMSSLPDRIRSLIQQRIALPLGNPSDYVMAVGHLNKKAEPITTRGRGYIYSNPPLLCQISLPQLADGREIADVALDMRNIYTGPTPISEMPQHIPLDSLPLSDEAEHIITPIGRCDDDDLSLFALDWQEQGPHFIVTGPPGSGKTTLLRTTILAAAQQYAPQTICLLVDFTGRSLRPVQNLKHVLERVTDVAQLEAALNNMNDEAAHTIRTVIVIDDYDLTGEALSNHPEILRQLRDLARMDSRVHLWVAGYLERVGDPLVRQLLLSRSGFGMSVKESLYNLNIRTTDLPNDAMPPGRAYFAQYNRVRVVQTAFVENMRLFVNRVNMQIWAEAKVARWMLPAQTQTPPPSKPETKQDTENDLDIDTQGLIEDLFGASDTD